MLASLAASKTARLIAACVCPVVGAGTLTMAVPKVREAVHKATAPREYALPKTRERLPASEPLSIAAAPCPDYGASGGYVEGVGTPVGPVAFSPQTFPSPYTDIGGNVPNTGGAIPEPHAWLQLLVGFALIGGSIRIARQTPSKDEAEFIEDVVSEQRDA